MSRQKKIIFLEIGLEFPRPATQSQELTSRDHLLYGEYPAAPGEVATPHPDQPPIAPGESVEIGLSDYEGTQAFLASRGYPPTIMALEIVLDDIIFEDGTKYNGGEMYRRDANDPTKWWPIREQTKNLNKSDSAKAAIFQKAGYRAGPRKRAWTASGSWDQSAHLPTDIPVCPSLL